MLEAHKLRSHLLRLYCDAHLELTRPVLTSHVGERSFQKAQTDRKSCQIDLRVFFLELVVVDAQQGSRACVPASLTVIHSLETKQTRRFRALAMTGCMHCQSGEYAVETARAQPF